MVADHEGNDDMGLSPRNYKLLMQFKENVSDIIQPGYHKHTDDELIKFCVARRWDLKKAEVMFRDAMSCRERMRLDHILEEYEPPEVITNYLTGGVACVDKEGCPVRVERFGCLDTKGIYYACRRSDLEKFKMYEQEDAQKLMMEQSAKMGKKIDKYLVIMDLAQISSKQLWRPGLQLYLHLVKLLEDNYPELVKKLIVVNAPKIFPIFFKVCRPLISEDMRNKLLVFGSTYQNELLKWVDEDELPAFLGGKQTGPDGDVYCSHKIRPGGPVPESLYLKDTIDLSEFETSNIAAGSKLVLKLPIDQPCCVISWEFMTKDKDIGFGLGYIPTGSDKTETLVSTKRVQCHMVPENGSYTCDRLGTYVLKFDNSYSWTKGKTLLYNVEVLAEDEDLMDEVKDMTDGTSFS